MYQLQVKQQLHSHKIIKTNIQALQFSSSYHINPSLSQFKTHKMAYLQNQKQTRKDKRKHFCAKVVKMFEFAKENIEFR